MVSKCDAFRCMIGFYIRGGFFLKHQGGCANAVELMVYPGLVNRVIDVGRIEQNTAGIGRIVDGQVPDPFFRVTVGVGLFFKELAPEIRWLLRRGH